jgi:hypothetical protein
LAIGAQRRGNVRGNQAKVIQTAPKGAWVDSTYHDDLSNPLSINARDPIKSQDSPYIRWVKVPETARYVSARFKVSNYGAFGDDEGQVVCLVFAYGDFGTSNAAPEGTMFLFQSGMTHSASIQSATSQVDDEWYYSAASTPIELLGAEYVGAFPQFTIPGTFDSSETIVVQLRFT